MYLTGCEGLWGMLITLTFLTITTYTSCNVCKSGHIDSLDLAIKKFGLSSYHLGLAFGIAIT